MKCFAANPERGAKKKKEDENKIKSESEQGLFILFQSALNASNHSSFQRLFLQLIWIYEALKRSIQLLRLFLHPHENQKVGEKLLVLVFTRGWQHTCHDKQNCGTLELLLPNRRPLCQRKAFLASSVPSRRTWRPQLKLLGSLQLAASGVCHPSMPCVQTFMQMWLATKRPLGTVVGVFIHVPDWMEEASHLEDEQGGCWVWPAGRSFATP